MHIFVLVYTHVGRLTCLYRQRYMKVYLYTNNIAVYMCGFLSVYLYISVYKHTHTTCETVTLMKVPVSVVRIISAEELHTKNIFVRFKFSIFQTSEISICSVYHKLAIYHNKSGN